MLQNVKRLEIRLKRLENLEIFNYSYHYMHKNRHAFRYDNASDPKARKLITYPHHKHFGEKLVASQSPELKKVLEEMASFVSF